MRRRLALLAVVVFGLAAACAIPPPEPLGRIVAVGDVHGAHQRLVALLQGIGLIDADGHWSGGNATFVQLGDLLDRGVEDRAVLELMIRLQQEAPGQGGRVVALLGNHEVMNLQGDLRYVAPATIASFTDGDSERRWSAAFAAHHPEPGADTPAAREAFRARHPPGYAEHREAFGPEGVHGRWLRKQPAIVVLGDVVFVHGGIHPSVAGRGVPAMQRQIAQEIEAFDLLRSALVSRFGLAPTADHGEVLTRAAQPTAGASANLRERLDALAIHASWLSQHPDGPLWFRGNAAWEDAELEQHLPGILADLGVAHIVVGHTAQLDGEIRLRGDCAVFLADTGLAGAPFYRRGQPRALEIAGGSFWSLDSDGKRILLCSRP